MCPHPIRQWATSCSRPKPEGRVFRQDGAVMEKTATAMLDAWAVAHAAARAIGTFDVGLAGRFAFAADGGLRRVAALDPGAVLAWHPATGWEAVLAADDPQRDCWICICRSAAVPPPGPLPSAIWGKVSTDSSPPIPEMRSRLPARRTSCICIGCARLRCRRRRCGNGECRQSAADNAPRRRQQSGAGDSRSGLSVARGALVFSDREAVTLRVCTAGSWLRRRRAPAANGPSRWPPADGALDLRICCSNCMRLGYSRIFVEGGGVTVSSFLEAGLLDRLHIAIAPLLIGEGRPAIRLPPQARLQDCLRLQHRVYRAGSDILFDCDLRAATAGRAQSGLTLLIHGGATSLCNAANSCAMRAHACGQSRQGGADRGAPSASDCEQCRFLQHPGQGRLQLPRIPRRPPAGRRLFRPVPRWHRCGCR